MTVPHPAPPADSDGVTEWPTAAATIPAPEGVTELDIVESSKRPEEGRPFLARFRTRRVLLVGVAVIVLAIIGALAYVLFRTRQEVTDTRQNLAFTQVELTGTRASLTTTEDELQDATSELSQAQSDLDSAKEELSSARDDLSTSKKGLRDFMTCYSGTLDAMDAANDGNYGAAIADMNRVDDVCTRAMEAWATVAKPGVGA